MNSKHLIIIFLYYTSSLLETTCSKRQEAFLIENGIRADWLREAVQVAPEFSVFGNNFFRRTRLG